MKDLENKKSFTETVEAWHKTAVLLKALKLQEAEMRVEICEHLLEDREVGTHTFAYDDFDLKAVKKVSMSLLQDELTDLISQFSDEERECISYTPKLSNTLYTTCLISFTVSVTTRSPLMAFRFY